MFSLSRAHTWLATLFDTLTRHERVQWVERATILAAALGLVVHLAAIALGRAHVLPEVVSHKLGTSYLAALYTPFSFILFAEVLLLILAIPRSMTRSLGKQFELVALIILRRVFKDLSAFDGAFEVQHHLEELSVIFLDMGGGLALFLLAAVFYHADARLSSPDEAEEQQRTFIERKKVIALGLGGLLFALAAYNLGVWCVEAYRTMAHGTSPTHNVDTIFYEDLFTVMIFTDVLILLLSMWRNASYHAVFRDAGFIISAVLLRLSLTLVEPYSAEIALSAAVFGILVLLVSHYHRYVATLYQATFAQVERPTHTPPDGGIGGTEHEEDAQAQTSTP